MHSSPILIMSPAEFSRLLRRMDEVTAVRTAAEYTEQFLHLLPPNETLPRKAIQAVKEWAGAKEWQQKRLVEKMQPDFERLYSESPVELWNAPWEEPWHAVWAAAWTCIWAAALAVQRFGTDSKDSSFNAVRYASEAAEAAGLPDMLTLRKPMLRSKGIGAASTVQATEERFWRKLGEP